MTKAPGFNLNWPRKKNNYFYPTNLFIWNQISITTGAKSKACSDIHWSWDGKKQRWLGNWRSVQETFTAMLNCLITTCNTSNNNWKCIPLLCQSLSDGLSPSQKLSTQTSIQWDCHIHLFTKLFFLTNWSLPKPSLHAKISLQDGFICPINSSAAVNIYEIPGTTPIGFLPYMSTGGVQCNTLVYWLMYLVPIVCLWAFVHAAYCRQ